VVPIIYHRIFFSFIFSFVVVWPNFENSDWVYQLCSGLWFTVISSPGRLAITSHLGTNPLAATKPPPVEVISPAITKCTKIKI